MRKSVLATLAISAGIAAYLFWAYQKLPAATPIKWSMASLPFAFGTRESFVGVPAGITLFLTALFLGAARTWPKVAWGALLALGVTLAFVHISTQVVLESFLPPPVNLALLVVLGAIVLGAAFPHRRRPAKRVQPF
jgi:hypothetical protein